MANRWGIPKEVENHVKERDTSCVYCQTELKEDDSSRTTKPSWEHIVKDIRINGTDNIALCCTSCNASKGSKLLEDWLKSDYCNRNGITAKTVAQVVKNAISNPPRMEEE